MNCIAKCGIRIGRMLCTLARGKAWPDSPYDLHVKGANPINASSLLQVKSALHLALMALVASMRCRARIPQRDIVRCVPCGWHRSNMASHNRWLHQCLRDSSSSQPLGERPTMPTSLKDVLRTRPSRASDRWSRHREHRSSLHLGRAFFHQAG